MGGCGRPVLFLREDKPIVAFGVLRKTIRQTGLAVHKGEEAGRAVIAPRNMWRANELRRKLEESCKGKRERGE